MSLKVVAPNSPEKNELNYQQSFLFKSLVRILGFTAALSVISYVCVTARISAVEFFSNYETFSKLLIQVYGDAAQRLVLDKFPNTKN